MGFNLYDIGSDTWLYFWETPLKNIFGISQDLHPASFCITGFSNVYLDCGFPALEGLHELFPSLGSYWLCEKIFLPSNWIFDSLLILLDLRALVGFMGQSVLFFKIFFFCCI